MQEEESEAKAEAERPRSGLTMFTGGSRLDDGAAGYSVVWKNGQSWAGIKTHMGYNQEASALSLPVHWRAPREER